MGAQPAKVIGQSFLPTPEVITIKMSRERYIDFLRLWLDHHPSLECESQDGWGDQSEED